MENNYYIIINGQPAGPMTAGELVGKGLTPDSMVWHEGLADWTKASEVPGLAGILAHQENGPAVPPASNPAQGTYYPPINQVPASGPVPWGTGGAPYSRPQIPHRNWLTSAICATVLGFLFSCIGVIFGIIAITQANSANNAYARGDKFEGDRLNSSAKTWTIVTYVFSGLGIIGSVFWVILTFTGAILGF